MKTRIWKQNGNDTRGKEYRVIKNSEVIKVGDWIVDEGTGVADVDANSEHILGYCTAISTPDKISFESPSTDTGDYGGTWVSSTKQYTAASDNADSGGDGILCEYIPVREGDKFVATIDADKGTTTGSDLAGYYLAIDTSDASQLDESTASTSRSSTQFRIENALTSGLDTEVIVSVSHRETSQYTAD